MKWRLVTGLVGALLVGVTIGRVCGGVIDPGAPLGGADFPAVLSLPPEGPGAVEGATAGVTFVVNGMNVPFMIQPGFLILTENATSWSDVVQFDNGEVGGNGRVQLFSDDGGISAALIAQVMATPAAMVRMIPESLTDDFDSYTASNVDQGSSGTYKLFSDHAEATPEPDTLALAIIGLGLCAYGGLRTRRRAPSAL